jgi:hypothetical protein
MVLYLIRFRLICSDEEIQMFNVKFLSFIMTCIPSSIWHVIVPAWIPAAFCRRQFFRDNLNLNTTNQENNAKPQEQTSHTPLEDQAQRPNAATKNKGW